MIEIAGWVDDERAETSLNKAPATSKNDLKDLMLVMLVMPPTHPWNFRNLF